MKDQADHFKSRTFEGLFNILSFISVFPELLKGLFFLFIPYTKTLTGKWHERDVYRLSILKASQDYQQERLNKGLRSFFSHFFVFLI